MADLAAILYSKKRFKIRQKYIVQQIVTKLSNNDDTMTSYTPINFS